MPVYTSIILVIVGLTMMIILFYYVEGRKNNLIYCITHISNLILLWFTDAHEPYWILCRALVTVSVLRHFFFKYIPIENRSGIPAGKNSGIF
jgi:hypothetical protein